MKEESLAISRLYLGAFYGLHVRKEQTDII
jgi:hypothetical protein